MNSVTMNLESNPLAIESDHPFLHEFIRQFRQQDTGGIYQNCSDNQLLQSLIRKQDSDSLGELGIFAFYHAITAEIEKETGKLGETFINFTQQGIGSVVICCGYLLVISESFQKANNFGFDSLESLVFKAEELIFYSLMKIRQFF